MPTVAFLGLGAIGAPMAKHLAGPDYNLAVWNRTAAKAASFAAEWKVRHAATPAEAAKGADVVITCLPTSKEVEALLDGPTGLLATMANGTALVDCTSGDPASSQRIAARLAERGIAFADAPVSGGVVGAEAGTLTVMVGGSPEVIARVMPVLKTFGENVVHCGAVGAGHAVKAVNQAMLAVHIWSLGEGLLALTKYGVAPELALEVINTSSGRSNVSMNLFTQRVIGRKFPRTFKLALIDKDMKIAAALLREQGIPSPLLQLTAELTSAAHLALGEEADHVETVRYIEAQAGFEIK